MSKSEYWQKVLQQRLSRRGLLQAGAVVGGGLWLGSALGCSGSNEEAGATNKPAAGTTPPATPLPKRGGTFRAYATAETRSLDPHIETSDGSYITRGYNGVLKFNPEGTKVVPDLAVSWEQPDDVTYIFKLNQGVKFHNIPPVNGRELTAEDVKFSITRQMTNPPGKFTHGDFFIGKVAKIDVVDPYTVKFTTNKPDATFLNYMANVWTKIVAREAVDQYGELNDVLIGTGPFMLTKRDKNVEAVMSRNPDYFKKGLPYLDQINIRLIADSSAQVSAFLAGELDVLTASITEKDLVRKAKPNCPVREGVTVSSFIFRTQPYDDKRPLKPPFDDKRVRNAIQLAINKQECVDAVYQGSGVPLVGMIPPDRVPWALPESDMIKQDIPKAKQLLAEAGYPNGFKAEIYTINLWYYSDTAQVIADQLAKIGITTEIKQLESAQYYTKMYGFDYQTTVGAILGSEEPERYLKPYFGATATNYRWGNPEIQKKIEEQSGILDVQKRAQAIHEIQRMILDDGPLTTLYSPKYTTFYLPRVQNYTPPWQNADLSYFETIWLSE